MYIFKSVSSLTDRQTSVLAVFNAYNNVYLGYMLVLCSWVVGSVAFSPLRFRGQDQEMEPSEVTMGRRQREREAHHTYKHLCAEPMMPGGKGQKRAFQALKSPCLQKSIFLLLHCHHSANLSPHLVT